MAKGIRLVIASLFLAVTLNGSQTEQSKMNKAQLTREYLSLVVLFLENATKKGCTQKEAYRLLLTETGLKSTQLDDILTGLKNTEPLIMTRITTLFKLSEMQEMLSYARKICDQCETKDDLFNKVCDEFDVPEKGFDSVDVEIAEKVWRDNHIDAKPTVVTHPAQPDEATMLLACMLSCSTPAELKNQGYSNAQIAKAQEFIKKQEQEALSIESGAVASPQPAKRKLHPAAREHTRSFDTDDTVIIHSASQSNSEITQLINEGHFREKAGERVLLKRMRSDTPRPSRFKVIELDNSFETDKPDKSIGAVVPALVVCTVDQEQTEQNTRTHETLFDAARAGNLEYLKRQYNKTGTNIFITDRRGLSLRDHAAQGFDKAWGKDDKKKASCLAVIRWHRQKERDNKP